MEFWESFPSNQAIHLGVVHLCFGVQAGFINFHESITKSKMKHRFLDGK
jgi:hypothetical protein